MSRLSWASCDVVFSFRVILSRVCSFMSCEKKKLLRRSGGAKAGHRGCGVECSLHVDTMPADVESTMPISTVPASSGRVRAARASLRRPRRVAPRDESQARGRFSVLSSNDDARQGVIDDATEVFDMTRDDSHGEDTPQAGPAVVPSTMVATPRAVPVALPPPVESQHHRRRRLVIVSQRDGGSDTETLRMSESGELETASGDGLSVGEGVVEEPAVFEDPVDVAPRATQHVAAFRTLETWSLAEIFQRRACVMRSVPFIMKAAYRGAMRVALQEVMRGRELNCGSRVSTVGSCSFFFRGCSCFVLREGGASRRSSWKTVSTSSIQASGQSCGQAACPTRRRPTKSHPDADAAFNVTRGRDGRTEHVLWFRWESFPPQEEPWKRYLWHLETWQRWPN